MLRAKTRKCAAPGCFVRFEPARPYITWHDENCGAVIALAKLEKLKASKAKAKRDADRKSDLARKQKLKTRSDYMREAQTAFNFYIRTRALYYGHVCISSGAPITSNGVGGGFDAGHYRSIGSAPHLRFNLNNVWGQSKQDNRYGAGASFEYRRGLIMRCGIEVVEALEANDEVRKFDITYLVRIKRIFTKKAKRLIKRMED